MARLLGVNIPRRFNRKLVLVLVVILFLIFFSQLIGNSIDDDEEWYKHPSVYFKEVTCEHDDYTEKLFDELTEKLSKMFEKLGISYFLCYGSLWGALKFQKTLPWDRNLDFCVIYHQIAIVDEQTLYQAFKQEDLNYYYNSRRGKYVVTYKIVSAEITIFEKIGNHVERVGWEKRLFPHLYLNFQNFPYQLVQKDLPRIKFNNLDIPAPHQEYEIQKYLYPDNWWKEIYLI
ncbi:hypothetical protein BpHYR1_036003 [Brachionus plicatilis]|uniref:LicD/FKTN/FKRP nucleotidyltransferase domain-containing protein n=1 Tax=Brachionus plicatilis TaxID=10195 RepID=A0A3M7SXV0_BRAPC|nr:hypothetical protein BpHYR1_036003 [Brachionus plicatilis]